jgi:hypothetical protein
MHGLGAGLLAGGDDLVHRQVGFLRRRRADADRLVGHGHVHRVLVGLGIHGDGLDAHLAGGLDDAAGDLAAVGNQDFLEHERLAFELSPALRAECCRACATDS